MSLAELLKSIRQRALMSQSSFASELGVSVATINRWENGRAKPNITTMRKLKSFCDDRSFQFSDIENVWFNSISPEKENNNQ